MKPQVTILLEEYNELLNIKDNPSELIKNECVNFARWMYYMNDNPMVSHQLSEDFEEIYNIYLKNIKL